MKDKGWLKLILEEVKADVEQWPEWMRSKELEDVRKNKVNKSGTLEKSGQTEKKELR